MAVETPHLSLLPQQLLAIKEGMNGTDGNANVYGTPVGYGGVPLMSGTTTETFVPVYGSGIMESFPGKNYCAVKAESGVTYNLPVSRKRTRDAINPMLALPNNNQNMSHLNPYTFLGDDISRQIQYQQLEIDQFIAQHTEKVKLELEERRRANSRKITHAVEAAIVKRLRSKDEEMNKIAKLNCALEDKVKSLFIENQIWRDLAQSNEATANALRSNLEQILSNVQNEQLNRADDNAESCCGSNYEDEDKDNHGGSREGISNRLCRNCGEVESCVLLLPCRHLCLCTVCGSSLHTCPVCKSTKNASVHVNMSSS
ncbi:E3 ubiquitin-protein ligase BOI [Heracleum sosnowskyi]|uniref:RING-type E3 ubiquitin transferase n=1 Tax=Heracleum sosnowskyi TaxID=360622 RepID=A0AAD8J519_9APIA|nr:E3 ubiquitin-protein ligase BOI [Heracleum sosnowskyi]